MKSKKSTRRGAIPNLFERAAKALIGLQVGIYTISSVSFLDDNTALICCQDVTTEHGTHHFEAEHWLDECTFHYNELYYDTDGNYLETEPVNLKPQLMRTFERLFRTFTNL